jgi:hypothetical protein
MLCTNTVSPSRANRSSSVSCRLAASRPEALSVNLIQNLAFELAFPVLVQSAHAHVPDPLSSHRRLQPSSLSGWGVIHSDGSLKERVAQGLQ